MELFYLLYFIMLKMYHFEIKVYIKLLEQPVKVLERVLEKRIICQVSIDNMLFGFMPGKGTTDVIFIMQQVQEKHQAKHLIESQRRW